MRYRIQAEAVCRCTDSNIETVAVADSGKSRLVSLYIIHIILVLVILKKLLQKTLFKYPKKLSTYSTTRG